MIRLDISTLVFFYILISAILLLVIWSISGYREMKRFAKKDKEYIWKCAICFNEYIDSRHEEISICPLCGSYNKRG